VSAEAKKLAIVETIQPPICSSCGRLIPPSERGVAFYCPNCGKILIWRCRKCRKLSIKYKCPACGFEGP